VRKYLRCKVIEIIGGIIFTFIVAHGWIGDLMFFVSIPHLLIVNQFKVNMTVCDNVNVSKCRSSIDAVLTSILNYRHLTY